MGFESGAITFRLFEMNRGLPPDVIQRFANDGAPPLDAVKRAPGTGWVTGRHLLDRNISEDTATVAGYLRLTLTKAERKVQPAIYQAECRMEELARMQAEGKPFLKREERSEVRKEVMDRLLPEAPVHLTSIPIVVDRKSGLVYASASSEKQTEALTIAFAETTGVDLVPLTPQVLALTMGGVREEDLPPTSFSPDCEDSRVAHNIGYDFLSWMWFYSETRGGVFKAEDNQEFGVILEGPLTFVMEGEGAHQTTLKSGSPLVSREAKSALLGGKKLAFAKLTLAREDEQWTAGLDAGQFKFSGVKLPKRQATDPVSRFQERMLALDWFRGAFMSAFGVFIKERSDSAQWEQTKGELHRWVKERQAKA